MNSGAALTHSSMATNSETQRTLDTLRDELDALMRLSHGGTLRSKVAIMHCERQWRTVYCRQPPLRRCMSEVIIARTCRNALLKVIFSDITHFEGGDVIVTTANNRLAGMEGVDGLVHDAAGPGLREECDEIARKRRAQNLQPCPVGTAVTTGAYDLPAAKLIHVTGPDCRRPNQDEGRRDLLRQSYEAMFEELSGLKKKERETVVAPPLSMDIFAYPHREGARLTMEVLLTWLDAEEDAGVKNYLMITREQNFITNLKTIYRESEDQLPGHDSTREYR